MLEGKTIVLGVTGSIAAYKAAELARLLVKAGASVKVVMTEAATHFISPLTFETLTRNKVATGLFEREVLHPLHHISLAKEADLILVAPATANILAKVAQGIADDLLSSTVLATTAPVIFAPAMHVEMYLNPATQTNLEVLKRRGYEIVNPETGELAAGDEGIGRLASLERIVKAVEDELAQRVSLEGVSVLVTAGGTQEPIDPVRFIGNRSSGKMGYALAAEARKRGAGVTLVSGPSALVAPQQIKLIQVKTAEEMRQAVLQNLAQSQIILMAAAVADFKPARFSKSKIKKEDMPNKVELQPTPDILKEIAQQKDERIVVGFALESALNLEAARKKLLGKKLDLIVVNTTEHMGSDKNQVTLVKREGAEELPLMYKEEVAKVIIDRVAELIQRRLNRGIKS